MPDPTQEIQYLSQADYDAKLKSGVKNLIAKGYEDNDIKLFIKGYKSRYAVQETQPVTTKTQPPTPKTQPVTPLARTDKRFNPDFALSPNMDLVKERQQILGEYEQLPPMQTSSPELDARLADVEDRIEASMTRKSNYKIGREKIADIEKQQNEIESRAYNVAKANNMDPIQVLETDGTYQALQQQKQQEQDLIALDEAVLQSVAEDTNADTGAMAFVKRIGRAFGIQDEAEQKLELDEKVQEQILLSLGGDLREKEKIANGFATLKDKEELITKAKVAVFKNERNKIKNGVEELAQSDLPVNEKIQVWNELQEQYHELNGAVGFDAADNIIKNSFDKSNVSNEFRELLDGDGFLSSTADAASTFLQEMYSIGFKSTAGFIADVMAGAGDMFTDQDRYSLYDAFSDTVYNIGEFQIAPNSEAEGTRIVDEEGNFDINFKTAAKTLAQTLPFSLQIINDVKKGKISGLEKSMGKLLNPAKSKKITNELTMLDSAFRATFSDNIKEGQEFGLDDNKARVFAGMLSTVEGLAQKIMPDTNFLGTGAGKAIVDTFKGNLKDAATKQAIGSATKNFFKNMALELGEEETVAFMNDIIKTSMLASHTNSEFWDMKAQKELMAATVLLSGALGSRGALNDVKANRQEFYNTVAENIEGLEQQFQAELNNPQLTETERTEIEDARLLANDIKNAVDVAPEKVTQEQIDLLVEKQRLTRENEALDPSLQTENNERIKEIDQELGGQKEPQKEPKKNTSPKQIPDDGTFNYTGKKNNVEYQFTLTDGPKSNLTKEEFENRKNKDRVSITITNENAEEPMDRFVGNLSAWKKGDDWVINNIQIFKESDRRQGLASYAYNIIENVIGKNLSPSTEQTDLGKAFSQGRKKTFKQDSEPVAISLIEKKSTPKKQQPKPKATGTKIKLGKTKGARTYTVKKNDKGILEVTASRGKKVSRPNDVLFKYADEVNLTKGKRYEPQPEQRPRDVDVEAATQSQNPAELAEIALRTKSDQYVQENTEPSTSAIVSAMVGKVDRNSFINFDDANNIGQQMALTYFGNQKGRLKPRGIDVIAQEVSEEVGREVEPQELVDLMKRYPNGMDSVLKEVRDLASNQAKQRFTELTGLPNSDRFLKKAIEQQVKAEQLEDIFERSGSLGIKSDKELLDLQREIEQAEQEIYGGDIQRGAEVSPVPTMGETNEGQPEVSQEDGRKISDAQEKSKVELSEEQEIDTFLKSLDQVLEPAVLEHVDTSYGSQAAVKEAHAEAIEDVKAVTFEGSSNKQINTRIIDNFEEADSIEIVGERVDNAQDVADIALLFRSPKIEKGMVIYTKNGQVVQANAETLGLSYSTTIAYGNNWAKMNEVANTLKADKIYLLHNHPSGNHTPSNADVQITQEAANASNVALEHLIINGDKFSLIDGQGNVTEQDYKKKPKPLFKKRTKIGADKSGLMEIGTALTKGGAPNHIIYLSSDGHINADELIDGTEGNLENYIEKQLSEFGARNFVVVTDGKTPKINALKNKPIRGKLDFIEISGNTAKLTGPGKVGRTKATAERSAVKVLFEDAPNYEPYPNGEGVGINEVYMPKPVRDIVVNAMKAEGAKTKDTKQAIAAGKLALEQTLFYEELLPPQKEFARRNILKVLQGNPIAPTRKNQVSGIKKELVPERIKADTPIQRRDMNDLLESGKNMIEGGTINPEDFVALMSRNPRSLNAEETAAMVYYKTQLDNQAFDISEKLDKAYEDNDSSKISRLELQLAVTEKKLEDYQVMQQKTAYEQGLALYVRRMMLTSEYELARQVMKAKAVGGGKISKEVEQKFKEYDKQIKKLDNEIEKLQNKLSDARNEARVNNPKAGKRGQPTKQEMARAAELLAKFRKRNRAVQEIDVFQEDSDLQELQELSRIVLKMSDNFADFKAKMMAGGGFSNVQQLRELYTDAGGKVTKSNNRKSEPYLDADGILHIPQKYIKDTLEITGVDTIEELTEIIENHVQKIEPNATTRQVRDLITDYGKTSTLSDKEIDVKLRRLKRVGKLISGMEEAQAGRRPKRSGLQRDKPTAQERKMQRELREALKDVPIDNADLERQQKSVLDGIKSRYRNQIEDLELQIQNREKKKPSKPVELDAEAERLKELAKLKREELEAIVGKPDRSNEQRVKTAIAQLQRNIDMYDDRIKNLDFSSIKGEPIPETPALKKARADFKAKKAEYDKLKNDFEPKSAKEERERQKKLKRLKTQLEKLNEKIRNKDLEFKVRKAKEVTSPEIEATQKIIDQQKQELERLREAEGILERKKLANYEKNLKRSIQNYQDRIAQKDFAPRKQRSKIQNITEEIRRLELDKARWKMKFDEEQAKWAYDNMNRWEKARETMYDVLNIPRSLMASADLSAPLRQGFLLSVRNPRTAVRSFKYMIRAAGSQKAHDDWLNALRQTNEYVLMNDSKLYLSEPTAELNAREERFMSKLASKMPWVRMSERAYQAYLNKLRAESFMHLANKLEKKGLDPRNEEDLKKFQQAASWINNATGRGGLGPIEEWGPALNAMFFSPRYVISRFNVLATPFKPGLDPTVRMEAVKSLVAYTTTGLMLLQLAKLMGADVEDDPRSSDFGKIRIDDMRFDIWAGFQQWAVLGARILSQSSKSVNTGKIMEFSNEGYFKQNTGTVSLRFLRSKMSPTSSFFLNWSLGEDVVGNEFDLLGSIGQMALPLWVGDMIEIYETEGTLGEALSMFGANFFGIGAQRFTRNEDKKKERKKTKDKEKKKSNVSSLN